MVSQELLTPSHRLLYHPLSHSASLKFKKLNKKEAKLGGQDSSPRSSTNLAFVVQLILFQLQCDEVVAESLEDKAPTPTENYRLSSCQTIQNFFL